MGEAPSALVDAYDAALFDLDGVVYLGPIAVPGAADAIRALRERGARVGFVTNNANRTPAAVAEHLVELEIDATPADVVTSAQAAAQLLVRRFGIGARIFAVGGAGVWAALEEVGLVGVRSIDDDPVGIIQGWGADLTWEQLNDTAVAVHRGAHWVATNTDPTRPTDRGLVPGNGAAVAAVRLAVDRDPEVAGKPFRPLVDETVHRLGAARPIFVGDRLDTDIAGAVNGGLDSMLVLTGSHGAPDLLSAPVGSRPTHLGYDIGALLAPSVTVETTDDAASCAGQRAAIGAGRLTITSAPATRSEAVRALWAATQLAWRAADAGRSVDSAAVVTTVEPLLRPGGH